MFGEIMGWFPHWRSGLMALWNRPVKLYIWSEQDMSIEGYRQWSKRLRASIRKIVFKPEMRIDVHYTQIDTKAKIVALIEDLMGSGVWIVRSLSRGKTKVHWKWVRIAKVIVMKHGDGYNSRIQDTHRLSRYKFFKDD